MDNILENLIVHVLGISLEEYIAMQIEVFDQPIDVLVDRYHSLSTVAQDMVVSTEKSVIFKELLDRGEEWAIVQC